MIPGKILLVNQSMSEVAAFDSESIPYVAVYVKNCSESERVEAFCGSHSYHIESPDEIEKIEAVRECLYLASYRDGSAKLCREVQNLLGIDSNCHSSYFDFFHDKFVMNEVLNNIRGQRKFGSLELESRSPFPGPGRYILKPRTLQGSLGVHACFVSNSSDWKKEISEYFSLVANVACDEGYLWESFAEGQEYSVDVYLHDGIVFVLGFARKGTLFHGNFVESSHVVGDVLTQSAENMVVSSIRDVFQKIGYRFGPAHVEFKIDEENRIHFIEFHPRPGGDNLIDLIWMSTGASFVEHLFNHLNGVSPNQSDSRKLFSVIQYLSSSPSNDCILFLSAISELKIKTGLSDSRTIRSSRDRPAYIMSRGVSIQRLAEIMEQTASQITWDQLDFIRARSRSSV